MDIEKTKQEGFIYEKRSRVGADGRARQTNIDLVVTKQSNRQRTVFCNAPVVRAASLDDVGDESSLVDLRLVDVVTLERKVSADGLHRRLVHCARRRRRRSKREREREREKERRETTSTNNLEAGAVCVYVYVYVCTCTTKSLTRHVGTREGANLLAAPRDEDELGALALLITDSDAEERKGAFVVGKVASQLAQATVALAREDDLLLAFVLEERPVRRRLRNK